jgi:myosin V
MSCPTIQTNRFEQLCINYANEKLQQRFTEDVFKTVQAEYQAEGIKWELISYEDNAEVLELLEGRLGILDLLNEEVRPVHSCTVSRLSLCHVA